VKGVEGPTRGVLEGEEEEVVGKGGGVACNGPPGL